MSSKTKPKDGPLFGWSESKFFLNFFELAKMLYFYDHPADSRTLMNSRDYLEAQSEFARRYANNRMAADLGLYWDTENAIWKAAPE